MESNDFNKETECLICYEEIGKDQPYAKIDDKHEADVKCHTECLEIWLDVSNRTGLITREPVNSYSLYHDDKVIETTEYEKIEIPTENTVQNIIHDTIQPDIIVQPHAVINNTLDEESCCCVIL